MNIRLSPRYPWALGHRTQDPHQWLTLEITYDCMFASGLGSQGWWHQTYADITGDITGDMESNLGKFMGYLMNVSSLNFEIHLNI